MPAPVPVGNVISGARARLFVDGQAVGYATGVDCSREIQFEPIRVLDNIEVSEFVPIGYECSASCRRVRVVPGSLSGPDLTIWPQVSRTPEAHLQNILDMSGGFDIQVDDRVASQTVALLLGAVPQRSAWSLDARGIIGESIDFLAIKLADEAGFA